MRDLKEGVTPSHRHVLIGDQAPWECALQMKDEITAKVEEGMKSSVSTAFVDECIHEHSWINRHS